MSNVRPQLARVTKKPGDVFKVPLSNRRYGLAQWLPDGTARFFRKAFAQDETPPPLDSLAIAFRVLVFRDTPGRYGWMKVCNSPVSQALAAPQRYAKKEIGSGEINVYYEGELTPATASDVKGLETLAVWAHPHLVERLEALLEGRESTFEKSLRIVA